MHAAIGGEVGEDGKASITGLNYNALCIRNPNGPIGTRCSQTTRDPDRGATPTVWSSKLIINL